MDGGVREEEKITTKIKDGLATVFVPGSTASVTTIEYEPGLIADIKELGERIAPSGKAYAHDETWGSRYWEIK